MNDYEKGCNDGFLSTIRYVLILAKIATAKEELIIELENTIKDEEKYRENLN